MGVSPEELLQLMPFAGLTGVEITSAAPAEVRGRMSWAPERCTTGGALHGGALLTLADSLGGVCAYLNLPPGGSTATLETKTNLLRAVRRGTVTGRSQPLHAGRSTIVVETRLFDDADRLVAVTLQTQAILP